MISPHDINVLAQIYLERHGSAAMAKAQKAATRFQRFGDRAGVIAWTRVEREIADLLRDDARPL